MALHQLLLCSLCLSEWAYSFIRYPFVDSGGVRHRGVRRLSGKRKAQSGKRKAHNRGLLRRDVFWRKKGVRQASKADLFSALRFALRGVIWFRGGRVSAARLSGKRKAESAKRKTGGTET